MHRASYRYCFYNAVTNEIRERGRENFYILLESSRSSYLCIIEKKNQRRGKKSENLIINF